MKKRASETVLGALHEAVAQTLLDKVLSGEASPAEINAAIKFLQNNGIEAVMTEDSTLDKLVKALPTFDDEIGEDEYVN